MIFAVLVYIGLIAICCIALYAVPSLRGVLERTYIAEQGSIDVKDEVSAFIVRDETVYVAAEDCTINRLAETDKLVKAGTRVVEITPAEKDEPAEEAGEEAGSADETKDGSGDKSADKDKDKSGDKSADKDTDKSQKDDSSKDSSKKDEEDAESGAKDKDKSKKESAEDAEAETEEESDEEVSAGKYTKIVKELGDSVVVTENGKTRSAGYISYFVDGAEAKLSTDSLDQLTEKDFKAFTGRKALKTPKKRCGKEYPLFKVVRNSKWYLVFYMKNEDAQKYTAGETVSIEINEQPITVTVNEVVSGRKRSRIVLTCKSFFEGFLEERELKTTITVVSAEGLVLEDDSIVEAPDGQLGVFVKNKLGEHVFKPVLIKADDGVKCVVFSDIYVDAGGNYVETIATYDEIIASPSEDDIASLKKEQQKEKKKEEAEKKDTGTEEPAATDADKKDSEKKDSDKKDSDKKDSEKKDSGKKDSDKKDSAKKDSDKEGSDKDN